MIPRKKKLCSGCSTMQFLWKSSPPMCKNCSGKKSVNDKEFCKTISNRTKVKIDADTAFYQLIWDKRPHNCEECGMHLGDNWRRIYFSHIISKGARNNIRHEEDNINLLCGGLGTNQCHEEWENGDRKSMKIYAKNQSAIVKLLQKSISKSKS